MDSKDDNNLNLPSDKCYSTLDTIYINDGNNEDCKNLEANSGEYKDAFLLCMRLKENLKNYDTLDCFGEMNDYKCKFLNLWVHDRLLKLKAVEETTMKSTLLGIWSKSKIFPKCNSSDFISYLDNKDYIKEKNLYDYALNYEYLENICKNSDDIPCARKLAEYITESKNLYNQVKSECEPKRKNQFQRSCFALNYIQEIYNKDELLNLICKRIEDENKSSRNHERRGFEGELTESYSFGSHSSGDASSSDSYKAIGTSLPILSVIPIGFVLYKFTGLGPMARNLLRRGRINGINSQEELTHELLENPYDSNAHPDLAETYIGYQPI
ncbi:PIR protein [Plasmodium ovale]|uniref:PIR Superfamily Protein n=2 Tax=Plasmodium ovale TaxID=36330 RepID=A0A1A8WIG0_PLAOA|nr:PIR Superfamily Protein [Plasmodium ovale curtisi]SBT84995.1 PIR protein [Plasmodium ovale]